MNYGLSGAFSVFVEAKLTLDAMPTVDAVPVVRCKECKNLGNNDGYYFCNAIGLAFGNKPNWFCADGERKDGEHEER